MTKHASQPSQSALSRALANSSDGAPAIRSITGTGFMDCGKLFVRQAGAGIR